MLIVSAPGSFGPERRYVLGVVLSDRLGLEWELRSEARMDVRLAMAGDPADLAITMPDTLFSTPSSEWLTPPSLPRLPLRTARHRRGGAASAGDPVPVIYGQAEDDGPVGTRSDSGVRLDLDIFGSVFFLLARYEEVVLQDRDPHGRLADAASLAVRTATQLVPLADLYVELLWHAITDLWPGLKRRATRYRAVLTHDVDMPFACREGVPSILHSTAADVLRRRDLSLAGRRLRLLVQGCGDDHAHDPWNVFEFLMDVAEQNGQSCSFNFLADPTGPGTSHYSLDDPWIRGLLRRVHARGHEVGYHGGYDSHVDPLRTRDEFERLTVAAAGSGVRQSDWGGRQHFLRWVNPVTWRAWDEAGLAYDSTLGFAEFVGFRSGTCHPYRAFDLLERRPMRLVEHPLIAMDTTWLLYMDVSLDRAAELVIEASRACRHYDGEFVGLWHNSGLASAALQRWYRDLVRELV